MTTPYSAIQPDRAQVDAMTGLVVLDFGTDWCGHCRASRPVVDEVLAARPDVRHMRFEDGSGRRLGRTFGVKLWPTLVFLRDGAELARLVRPRESQTVADALAIFPAQSDRPPQP